MTAGVVAAVRRRLGRRGAYLLVTGITWTLYGIGVIIDPRVGTMRAAVVLRDAAPLQVWGAVWVAGGVVAAASAWAACPRWRALGFGAAMLPPLLWSLAFAWAWATGEYPRAWTGAAVWAGAAAKVWIVAGWTPRPGPVVLSVVPPPPGGGALSG
ncbi:hypothetical protein [Streptomyces bohaiensis]|uniref:hypothetical protein n=1 Tax=Streptomyces bohaiensis TaxID=1431344 RepID=UPI003B791288